MRLRFLGWSLAGLTTASAAPPHDGLKIVVRESFPAGITETTEYVARDRARTEWRLSPELRDRDAHEQVSVHIRRCDLGKTLFLNEADRTYAAAPISTRFNLIERFALSMGRPFSPHPATPEIVVETTTVDTGERKMAFGYEARRVVTTRRQTSMGSGEGTQETVTDAWYIDLDTRVSCERAEEGRGRAVLIATTATNRQATVVPRVTFKDIGTPDDGFAIDARTTSRVVDPSPREYPGPVVTHRIVTELTRQSLDASLFEIPNGFRSTDGLFGSVAARFRRTASIIGSVVTSWFR